MLVSLQHQKGGTSKSTIAWNLAITLSNVLKNIEIEVVDLDRQKTLTINNSTRTNLKDYKELNIRSFTDVEKLKEYYSQDNDKKLIIVDTGGFDSSLNRLTAMVSDCIITPVSDSEIDLQGLKTYEQVLKQISKASGEVIKTNVLLSLLDSRSKDIDLVREFIEKSEHFNLFETAITRRKAYINSIASGKSVIEFKKDKKAVEEMMSLIQEIRKTLSI